MTSEPNSAFVWIWLLGANEPVVCGRLDDADGRISFVYARSYLARADAVAVYAPELALRAGDQFAASGNRLPLCIDDAMPDSWGRRLVNHRLGVPNGEFGELTYLLASGSDRIGALDFQLSATQYEPRDGDHPAINELAEAAALVEAGLPLSPELEAALIHGTAVGGARPKALLDDGTRKVIAKFSSSTDTFPVVQGEYVAMELARRAGINAATVEITQAAGRHALLVERFDRGPEGQRSQIVSALTVLGLTSFPEGRYASYVDFADQVRARFTHPDATLRELYARIAFNILCGNTDDHGRNHAAFVHADSLVLAPAYDVCPQPRTGRAARQAMALTRDGRRDSRVELLIAAADIYHLGSHEARELVGAQVAVIQHNWNEVCEQAKLTAAQRNAFMSHQFLNAYALS